jgi:hypothetical protein
MVFLIQRLGELRKVLGAGKEVGGVFRTVSMCVRVWVCVCMYVLCVCVYVCAFLFFVLRLFGWACVFVCVCGCPDNTFS